MKTMTCRELGGACDLEFHANTFDEIAQMSQKHGKEMFQRGDKAHLEAMNKMKALMQSEDGMTKWMANKRKEFDAKPDRLKRFQCSVDIAAPPFKVYQMLIGPESYKQWTSAFGDGLYFEGSWQKSERIRFLTPDGHGVISEIAEVRPNEFLSVRHLGYINDDGVEDTSSEAIRAWAPAYENYTFTATPQGTKLTVDQDITDDFESMPEAWPKALEQLKALCENRTS